jgi:hypothetical protein
VAGGSARERVSEGMKKHRTTDSKLLERKMAVLCVIELIRNWQCDGIELAKFCVQPDEDEIWEILKLLCNRANKLSRAINEKKP